MSQVGDVVVCVDASPDYWDPYADQLVERKVYRVAVVGHKKLNGALALAFRSLPSNVAGKGWAWSAHRFRKVTAADEQFTASIRACRDAHSPAPVA